MFTDIYIFTTFYTSRHIYISNLLLALEVGSYFIFNSVIAVKEAAETLPWVFFIFLTLCSTEVMLVPC